MSENTGTNNNSLRTIVKENSEAMHKVSSRLGEVSTIRNNLDTFREDLDNQVSNLFGKIEALALGNVEANKSIKEIKDLFKLEISKVEQKMVTLKRAVDSESVETKDLQKRVEVLAEVVTNRSRWYKRYWVAVGVLLVSLVGCLVYLDYKMSAVAVVAQKQKVQKQIQTPPLKPLKVEKDSALLPNLSKPVVKNTRKYGKKYLNKLRFYKS